MKMIEFNRLGRNEYKCGDMIIFANGTWLKIFEDSEGLFFKTEKKYNRPGSRKIYISPNWTWTYMRDRSERKVLGILRKEETVDDDDRKNVSRF